MGFKRLRSQCNPGLLSWNSPCKSQHPMGPVVPQRLEAAKAEHPVTTQPLYVVISGHRGVEQPLEIAIPEPPTLQQTSEVFIPLLSVVQQTPEVDTPDVSVVQQTPEVTIPESPVVQGAEENGGSGPFVLLQNMEVATSTPPVDPQTRQVYRFMATVVPKPTVYAFPRRMRDFDPQLDSPGDKGWRPLHSCTLSAWLH
ncbi:hypothetical protein MTO96_035955 [Rhipicephalus appendiculatus]